MYGGCVVNVSAIPRSQKVMVSINHCAACVIEKPIPSQACVRLGYVTQIKENARIDISWEIDASVVSLSLNIFVNLTLTILTAIIKITLPIISKLCVLIVTD